MLISLMTIPLLLGAGGERWGSVAKSEVKLAQELGKENVKFGPEFIQLMEQTVESCQPVPSKVEGRSPAEVRRITLFCQYSCTPWHDAWADALAPCEEEPAPDWCSAGRRFDQHFQFEQYFEALTATLQHSSNSQERYNIMAIASWHLSENVLRDFHYDSIDDWLAPTVSAYLQGAPPTDAIEIARQLNESVSLGRRSIVAREFGEYADHATSLSTAERRELHVLAKGLKEKPN